VAALLWLCITFLFVDEWRAARNLLHAAQAPRANRLRVVSLNCAGGSAVAAGEVAAYRPDVVLLQESPGRPEVEALARRLYGSPANAVSGPDGSLMAAGMVEPLPLARKDRMHFVAARVRLPAAKRPVRRLIQPAGPVHKLLGGEGAAAQDGARRAA
jgi:hypothetical protein